MNTQNLNDNDTVKTKTVSVKLDGQTRKSIDDLAKEAGLSTSDYIRKLIADSRQNKSAQTPPASNGKPDVANQSSQVELSDSSLQTIAELLNTIITGAMPQTIEINMPLPVQPDREYLRKISGLQPESNETLTSEEEAYLSNLKAAIEADVRTTLLQKENSVPLPITENSQLQKNMLQKMIDIRENLVSEKMPTLTSVFQKAIAQAFYDDARSLYNSSLFKATYGFDYSEFKAVFDL